METFYINGKSIIGFCVLVLIFNMVFDQKTTEKFVLLVLFSMCILNAEKFTKWFNNTFSSSSNEKNETKVSESFTDKEWQKQNEKSNVNKHYIA